MHNVMHWKDTSLIFFWKFVMKIEYKGGGGGGNIWNGRYFEMQFFIF